MSSPLPRIELTRNRGAQRSRVPSQLPKHEATPDWAESCIDRILTGDDPDQLNALLELLAAIAPTFTEEKYKHEIAWAAIHYGYKKTEHCRDSCRRYVRKGGEV